jgi:hypothetical protein
MPIALADDHHAPLFEDQYLPLPRAAKLLPPNNNGKAPSIQTLRRWAKRGSRNVRLELTFFGGRVYVSRQALLDFIAKRNAAPRQITETSPSVGASRAAARLIKKGA